MKTLIGCTLLLVTLGCTIATSPGASSTTQAAASSPADPFLWLEAVDDERALSWVRDQNERTRRELATSPLFQQLYADALAALNSTSRVPSVSFRGDYLYNLWKSAAQPRGLYRRTSLAELQKADPRWETVLDIDALSRAEGKAWVFGGMTCLGPENLRCLVSLSPGGGDAEEIREFDSRTLRFVENGFFVPTAKTNVEWIDEDNVYIGTDFGAGSTTSSGYPRIVKRWRRGTPLSSATTVYEGDANAVSISARHIKTKSGAIDIVDDSKTFWTSTYYQFLDGKLHRLDVPESAVLLGGFKKQLVFKLMDDWTVDRRRIKAGAIVLTEPHRLRGGAGAIDVLVEPTESEIVEGVEITDDAIFVTSLRNVQGRLYRYAQRNGVWAKDLIAIPESGAASVMSARDETGDALVMFQSFTTPPTLYHVAPGSLRPTKIMAQEATFDGSRIAVEQQWTVSKDGTRIPYFVVAQRNLARDGKNPLHIFSYGGFRNALTPSYSGSYEELYGAYGKLWLERGGVFVLANIRGGGEFGPAWHSKVLKENRQKVFEDFEAISADVVKRGYTSSDRIGIEGRSNGGLLTLATMARRPELYGAVISGAPLADMQRYHQLLAGASWMAEYGDPAKPEEWSYISAYSPYQNFKREADYPPLFVYASTRDDRVHPGHARKSVARLQALGHAVWYYENIEGGHGGSSTNEQLAYRVALSYAHLWRHLGK